MTTELTAPLAPRAGELIRLRDSIPHFCIRLSPLGIPAADRQGQIIQHTIAQSATAALFDQATATELAPTQFLNHNQTRFASSAEKRGPLKSDGLYCDR